MGYDPVLDILTKALDWQPKSVLGKLVKYSIIFLLLAFALLLTYAVLDALLNKGEIVRLWSLR